MLILGKFYKFFYDRKIFLAFAAMPFGTALRAPFALGLGRSITFYLFLAIGTFFRVSFEKLSFTKF